MIIEITKSEYLRLKTQQKRHEGFIDCIPFKGIDNKYYKNTEKGVIGARAVWSFQLKLKDDKKTVEKQLQFERIYL